MTQLKWYGFPLGNQHGWDGLAEAGIETFTKDKYSSFIREMFQNSLDAKDPGLDEEIPVKIKISLKRIPKKAIPDFETWKSFLNKMAQENQNKELFNMIRKEWGDEKVKLLLFEDSNTIGLDPDTEVDGIKKCGTFTGLVHADGLSLKNSETSGGAYGIGKNAIFGMSKSRTVFFSSMNKQGKCLFQGVTKLATFLDDEGRRMTRRLNLGIREKADDPGSPLESFESEAPDFTRIFERTNPGTTQAILFPFLEEDWVQKIQREILRNYWPALHNGSVSIIIDDDSDWAGKDQYDEVEDNADRYYLNKSTVLAKAEELFSPNSKGAIIPEEGNPLNYIKCYQDQTNIVQGHIPNLGEVQLHLSVVEEMATKRIAYIRNNMVICAHNKDARGYSSIPYVGAFECLEPKGNAFLKDMENPRHDTFSADSYAEKHPGKKKIAVQVLKGIREFIKTQLEGKRTMLTSEIGIVKDLEDYFKGGAMGSSSTTRENNYSNKETPFRKAKEIDHSSTIQLGVSSWAKISFIEGPVEGEGAGSADGTGGGQPSIGPGRKKRRTSNRGSGPYPGGKTPKTKISARIFRTEDGVYEAHLNGSTPLPPMSNLILAQVGESGTTASFKLVSVTDGSKKALNFVQQSDSNGEKTGYLISNVALPAKLELKVVEGHKSGYVITSA